MVQGFGLAESYLASVGMFGMAYMSVIIVEPLVDLAALAGAKAFHDLKGSIVVEKRLFAGA